MSHPRLFPLISWILMLAAWSGAVPVAAAPAAELREFSWTPPTADEVNFNIEFVNAPTLKVTDALIDKRYFYLDFHGAAPPKGPSEFDLKSPLLFHVTRVYYAQQKVLRFVFYTQSDIRFKVLTSGATTFRVQISKYAPEPLAQAPSSAPSGTAGARKIVIIDPGHGGQPNDRLNSMGANTSKPIDGRTVYEKEITLQIAKRLEAIINRSPNMVARMTRTKDEYVSLDRRIEIANELQGDLFVSIHLNATDARRKTARGFEVFYLSDSRKAANKMLLALENDEHIHLDGPKTDDKVLREILTGLMDDSLRQRQAESSDLANAIDEQFRRTGPFKEHHRGVKSAAFRVLMNYGMPAVLIECGFIDNPEEAAQLVKPDVQEKIAGLIFNGVNRYFALEDPDFKPLLVSETGKVTSGS